MALYNHLYMNPEAYSHGNFSPEISHHLGLDSSLLHMHLILRPVDFRVCSFHGGGRPTIPYARSHKRNLWHENEGREKESQKNSTHTVELSPGRGGRSHLQEPRKLSGVSVDGGGKSQEGEDRVLGLKS